MPRSINDRWTWLETALNLVYTRLEKIMTFDDKLSSDVAANTADLAALQASNAALIATLNAEIAANGTPSAEAQAALTQLEANNAAMVTATTPPATTPAA